jgi:hypothetical protein
VSEERYNDFLAENDPKKGTMAHTWFVDGISDASTLVERCEKTFQGKVPRFTTTMNPGSLSSVNLLSNGMGIDQARALASILKGHPTLKSLCGNNGDETVLDMSGKNVLPADAIMLAPEIAGNGAMTRMNISNNQLCGHWKTPDFSGFKALAAAIEQHKLLTLDTVDITSDLSGALDVSGQNLGTAGAKMMAAFIKGNGAILSVNLLKNDIGVEQARALVSILKEHPTLKSLCGNSGDETELDMSGKMKGATDIIMLVPEMVDNGAISTLIVNSFPLPIQDIKSKAELDFSGNRLKVEDAIVIAALIPSNVSTKLFPHPCYH